jgi:ABC-type lipoprotein export system ATPase subunit
VPLIRTDNLTKVYGKGETAVIALDHLTMSVEQGEFVAVMGPSGCGKSTLLHLLGGLDRPSVGSVMIDGSSLSTLSDNALSQLRRRKIGFIFQFFNLIPILSAVDNAALPLLLDGKNAAQSRQKATEWLQKVGLGARLSSLPDQLSGGQQQRVAVARALISDPMLVLADEGAAVKALAAACAAGKPASVTAVGLSETQLAAVRELGVAMEEKSSIAELGGATFDDIVYFGATAETIEQLNDCLANRGLINIVTGGRKIGRAVTVGYKFLHVSNANTTSFNPGLDNNVVYVGYSFIR